MRNTNRFLLFIAVSAAAGYSLLSFTIPAVRAQATADDDSDKAHREFALSSAVISNMHVVQLALETYYANFERYPAKVDDQFKTYFSAFGRSGGTAPENPYNHSHEWPVLAAKIGTIDKLRKDRTLSYPSGTIVYEPLDNGKAYAIVGFGRDKKAIPDRYVKDSNCVLTSQLSADSSSRR